MNLFASELRLARSAQGFSQEQLAVEISYSTSLAAMVETGKRTPSRDFAARCDEKLTLLVPGLLQTEPPRSPFAALRRMRYCPADLCVEETEVGGQPV